MVKTRVIYQCLSCDAEHPKWSGRCGTCGEWNTLQTREDHLDRHAAEMNGASPTRPIEINDVELTSGSPRPTGIGELDRVLGGGLVPGSVTLIGGEPGIGKSTLLLQLVAWWPGRALYITAEESASQVRARAERVGAVRPDLWILAETSRPAIDAAVAELRPDLVVVDSIQTVSEPTLTSPPGSVNQVRTCAHHLATTAKATGLTTVIVGHVTKDGGLAGPRALEHIVDTVVSFDGDRHHDLRLLRTTKHRFGPTGELGLLAMTTHGLSTVPDASALFLTGRRPNTPGCAVTAAVEGRRPLIVEIQALTERASTQAPVRRTAHGIETARLNLLLAVLNRHHAASVARHDVYVSTSGGLRVTEPAVDLAVCAAVVSAAEDLPIRADTVMIGEVGLAGELRAVGQMEGRLREAARLGFRWVIAPARTVSHPEIEVIGVDTLADALDAAGFA